MPKRKRTKLPSSTSTVSDPAISDQGLDSRGARSEVSRDKRQERREQVEVERRTRTCDCPHWERHSPKCPVNLLLADDNPNLSAFEVIRRKKDKERFVEGIGKNKEVLIGTEPGSNTIIGIDRQAHPPITG